MQIDWTSFARKSEACSVICNHLPNDFISVFTCSSLGKMCLVSSMGMVSIFLPSNYYICASTVFVSFCSLSIILSLWSSPSPWQCSTISLVQMKAVIFNIKNALILKISLRNVFLIRLAVYNLKVLTDRLFLKSGYSFFDDFYSVVLSICSIITIVWLLYAHLSNFCLKLILLCYCFCSLIFILQICMCLILGHWEIPCIW